MCACAWGLAPPCGDLWAVAISWLSLTMIIYITRLDSVYRVQVGVHTSLCLSGVMQAS